MKLRIAAAALALAACRGEQPAAPPAGPEGKPELHLLTSLPLAFGEGFVLDAPKHPALAALEQHFAVTLVDGPEALPPGGLLLAVQPQALTAERLVALDRWVRQGGRLLLLADPRLVWDSSRPLGDRFRPPYAFPDTGLLQHWGLQLGVDPAASGPALRQLGRREVLTASPGRLSSSGRACAFSADSLVARCQIGRGHAVVVADADLVQAGVEGGLDGPTGNNHPALVAELQALRTR